MPVRLNAANVRTVADPGNGCVARKSISMVKISRHNSMRSTDYQTEMFSSTVVA